jgi:hypothetical protein
VFNTQNPGLLNRQQTGKQIKAHRLAPADCLRDSLQESFAGSFNLLIVI